MLPLAAAIGVPLPPHPTVALCSDDCPTARNGVCDDGGALFLEQGWPSADGPRLPEGKMAPEHTLRCDLGTDCADCGPRYVSRPATLTEAMPTAPKAADTAAWSSPPVKLLREMDVEVRAAWTRTQPAFIMPYTDPKKDIDVSGGMASTRLVEGTSSRYFGALSRECCANGGLMLDVGSNFGWFALYAATMGCRVVAWEPVPVFRAFLELGAQLNNLTHLIHVRAAAVSDRAGGNVTMRVPRKGLWGAASVDGLNVLKGSNEANSGTYTAVAPTETLDGLVTEQACAMKMDVEGFEPFVVDGAKATLRERPPRAVLTEYTPGVVESHDAFAKAPRYPRSLQLLREAGYAGMWQIGAFGCGPKNAISRDMTHGSWARLPLGGCPAVTDATLAAEARGAQNMAASHGNFAVPWDLHPASLHATFAHNTDLLLSLDARAVPTRGAVGVAPASPFGLGGGSCNDTMRDAIEHGNVAEVVGRRCLSVGDDGVGVGVESRAETLRAAARWAEAPHGPNGYVSIVAQVKEEAQRWRVAPPTVEEAQLQKGWKTMGHLERLGSDGSTQADRAARRQSVRAQTHAELTAQAGALQQQQQGVPAEWAAHLEAWSGAAHA